MQDIYAKCMVLHMKVFAKTEGLEYALKDFFIEDDSPKLLEIFTPKDINDEVLLKLF